MEYLEFTHSDGVEMDFHFAIDVVTDLAAILLECSVSGSVNLQDLDEYNTPARRVRITATPEEHDAMNKALADFVHAPLEYDLSEMMGEDEITDMAYQVEMLRKELYEASGRNRNYHVKAEDVKDLLPGWEGADGCIATNRITVEGCKVGYCYREKPDGGWDSGWRFTAGDESEEYMDDPNNARDLQAEHHLQRRSRHHSSAAYTRSLRLLSGMRTVCSSRSKTGNRMRTRRTLIWTF